MEQGVHGKPLYIPLDFAVKLKLFEKKIIKSLKNLKQTKKREETLSREEQVELSPCLS